LQGLQLQVGQVLSAVNAPYSQLEGSQARAGQTGGSLHLHNLHPSEPIWYPYFEQSKAQAVSLVQVVVFLTQSQVLHPYSSTLV
jgi:hypothetical protein